MKMQIGETVVYAELHFYSDYYSIGFLEIFCTKLKVCRFTFRLCYFNTRATVNYKIKEATEW